MWQLLAEGRDAQQRLKVRVEHGHSYTLGRSDDCDITVPWEPLMSRVHCRVTPNKSSIQVEKVDEARNPIFVDGEGADSFEVKAGSRFVIGTTRFLVQELQSLSPLQDAPVQQISFTRADLEQAHFEDGDRRLEALVRLPAVIRSALNQEEQGSHLAALILAGIRHAEAVAVVTMDDAQDVEVTAWERRTETSGPFRPSTGLVRDAMAEWRTVLHVWESATPQMANYTIPAEFDWAFCTPVGKFRMGSGPSATWGIYVTGRLDQPLSDAHPLRRNLRSDVRFTQLIGEVINSADQTKRMEGQLSVLRQFLSPPILHALEQTGRHGELNVDLLQPKICTVTVLFCDLRGFSQRAEESIDDLPGLLSRVNGALEIMTREILEYGGVTGDFLGDAVLGFWGWPFPSEDAPLKACRAALAIRNAFTRIQRSPQHPLADFQVGIGVANGRAIAGKIGTGGRVSVTVFGPVVNLASRLEQMTKRLRVPVILDEATAALARERLPDEEGRIRNLATVLPYGLETPLTVSELVPPAGEMSELTDADLATFERGVELFRQGDWDAAYRALHEIPSSDQAQDFLLALITQHSRVAPPGWRGIIEITGK